MSRFLDMRNWIRDFRNWLAYRLLDCSDGTRKLMVISLNDAWFAEQALRLNEFVQDQFKPVTPDGEPVKTTNPNTITYDLSHATMLFKRAYGLWMKEIKFELVDSPDGNGLFSSENAILKHVKPFNATGRTVTEPIDFKG